MDCTQKLFCQLTVKFELQDESILEGNLFLLMATERFDSSGAAVIDRGEMHADPLPVLSPLSPRGKIYQAAQSDPGFAYGKRVVLQARDAAEGAQDSDSPEKWESAVRDFKRVRNPRGGLFASMGPLYQAGKFGRDSLETSEDRQEEEPELVEEVLLDLAKLQGRAFQWGRKEGELPFAYLQRVRNYMWSEEQPGSIIHEFRSSDIFGPDVALPEGSQFLLDVLSRKWGGTKHQVRYYGTVDANSLFVRLGTNHIINFPERRKKLLKTTFLDVNGQPSTFKHSLVEAAKRDERLIDASDIGQIEFFTQTPYGHPNPVWTDSNNSYAHADGTLANHSAPIAPVEVNGLAFDGFMGMGEAFSHDSSLAEDAKRWTERAKQLQKNTLAHFWMPDKQFFAMGLDRDERTGEVRQIDRLSSNGALLLDTGIFDSLPFEERKKYISGTVSMIMSDEFLTDAGIRCTGVSTENIPILDQLGNPIPGSVGYHEKNVAWIKQTYDITKGLHRQGFHRLAEHLENRILNAVNIAGENYEFFYVNDKGEANYNPHFRYPANMSLSDREIMISTNLPEGGQAWTTSAVLAIKRRRVKQREMVIDTNSWQYQLEEKILQKIKLVEAFRTKEEIREARAKAEVPPFLIEVFGRGIGLLTVEDELAA